MEEKRALNFNCMQDLDPTNWDFPDEDKQKIFVGDPVITAKQLLYYIYSRLQKAFESDDTATKVVFVGFLHNHDTAEVWNNVNGHYVTRTKHSHVHFFIQLQYATKKPLHVIAEAVGIEPQYVEIPKGRYGVENSLAYLVHAKDGDKYQYDPAEAMTFDSFDYQKYYNEHRQKWNYVKSTQVKKNINIKKDWLIEQIQHGNVTKKQVLLDKNFAPVYANNMVQLNEAFNYYSEQQIAKSLSDFEAHKFALTTIFVTGKPRVGKNFLAKKLIKSLIQQINEHYKKQWQVYQTAATNPFDDYGGEQILFLDDIRANSMTATDWLKLMDPLNSSPLSARYHNKQPASPVIIITSYKTPEEFFGFMKGQSPDGESLDQFLGRLSFVAKVTTNEKSDDSKQVKIGTIVHYRDSQYVNITPTEEHSHSRYLSFLPKYNSPLLSPEDAVAFLTYKVLARNDPNKEHIVKPKQMIEVSNPDEMLEKTRDNMMTDLEKKQSILFGKDDV